MHHLGTQPGVHATGRGVDLLIVRHQADLAALAHRLLLFSLTLDPAPPRDKTGEGMPHPAHFGCGTFLTDSDYRKPSVRIDRRFLHPRRFGDEGRRQNPTDCPTSTRRNGLLSIFQSKNDPEIQVLRFQHTMILKTGWEAAAQRPVSFRGFGCCGITHRHREPRVGKWESRVFGEISKGRWEGRETRFRFSALSIGPAFPRPRRADSDPAVALRRSAVEPATRSSFAAVVAAWPCRASAHTRCRSSARRSRPVVRS